MGWNNFVKQAEYFTAHEVVIGWIENKKERKQGDAINNATLATIHEYGTTDGSIPEGRLGLREWTDRKSREIADHVEQAYKEAIPRGDAKRALNRLGLWATNDWKSYQRTVQPGPPLAGRTDHDRLNNQGVAEVNKGTKKKLVDTGQLVNGITYDIRRKSV